MTRRMIFPILLGLVGCAILIGLGIWQVQRMQWKAGVLARAEAMIAQPPGPLPPAPTEAADEYRAVVVQGRFAPEAAEVLAGVEGASPGVRIIGVFVTTEGRRVLVDRGFLADEDRRTPRANAATEVAGNLLWPEDADRFTPPPDPATGLWYARDLPAMAARFGTEPLMIVASGPTGDGIEPRPVDTSAIPNNHWGYAIQWFSMAVVWGVMTLYLLWRIRQRTV